ncbi:MAG TPA: stage II sporulation protein R [Syntrophomonadaceae bacterium]|nr:stage II sporulation protein R [Syntrophomonadaceae bacterium]
MIQRRNRIVLFLCCLLITLLFIPFVLGIQAKKAFTTNNLVRLHVIANSDKQQDQEVKFIVRDQVVEVLREQLNGAKNYQDALKIISKNRAQLASVAKEAVAAAGFSYPVRVELGHFAFPARAYGNVVMPQGEYEALRIVLGEGKGANWWCVLFPPLCFVDISGNALEYNGESAIVRETLAQQGIECDENEVDLRFRLLDWMRRDDGYLATDKSSK